MLIWVAQLHLYLHISKASLSLSLSIFLSAAIWVCNRASPAVFLCSFLKQTKNFQTSKLLIKKKKKSETIEKPHKPNHKVTRLTTTTTEAPTSNFDTYLFCFCVYWSVSATHTTRRRRRAKEEC